MRKGLPTRGSLQIWLTVLVWSMVWNSRADLWVTGYYAGWNQSYLPPSKIDFSALTHVIHFSLVPKSDGTLNTNVNGLSPSYSTALVTQAHAAGVKAIICVGGASSETGFQGAAADAHRTNFINNLVNYMTAYNYDGIDLDWEPLPSTDFGLFTNLVNEIRTALNAFGTHKLLTVAAAAYPPYLDPPTAQFAMYASLQNQFDQINVMTYDLSGPYSGWVTWFNSPIYDGGYRFPSTGGLIPSTDGAVTNFIGQGISAGKLAIGIGFYGDVWAGGGGTSTGGAALPRQTWTTAPAMNQIAYHDLMSTLYQSNLYHWDSAAQAAYLSIDKPGATNDNFVTYDDEHTCQAKVSYARNHLLGGVMIWELGDGYRSTQPAGQQDTLLQSIMQTLKTPGITSIQRTGTDVYLSFASAPLGLYRVQWTSNLSSASWLTLTNNVPGTSGPMQIVDPGAVLNNSARYYRIQTPP
jgi:chitinase